MITHPAFTVEPWAVTEDSLNLDVLAQSESVFALSNGHIGLRGNLDEGEPFGLPGTYLNGFYETRPLPYAEAGYGYPEDGQTVVNATNGKIIRLLVDDEPFDIRYGELLAHTRTLDLRAGELRRVVRWRSPSGREIEVTTTRIVSFVQRSVAAIRYEVKPIDGRSAARRRPVRAGRQRAGRRPVAAIRAPPPRCARRCRPRSRRSTTCASCSSTAPRHSGLRMAAGMDHVVERFDGLVDRRRGRAGPRPRLADRRDRARRAAGVHQVPGLRLVEPALDARPCATRSPRPSRRRQAHRLGRARRAAQREYLDDYWERADVEIEGDGELQQAVRFALFHTLQAGARAERRAIPAKGLTGPGYDGHVFWDTETFVLPVLTYTRPDAVVDALLWRHATLDLAMERAQTLRLEGAAFPWRTIRGQECSAYWPAGTGAFHINADIADAVIRYMQATGDEDVRGRRGARAARPDGAAVALARPPRPRGRVPHRRRHRAGRVLGGRRRQRLHEPDGRAEPARWRPRSRRATRTRRARSASTRRRSRPGATPRRTCTSRTTGACTSTRRTRGFTHHELMDFEGPRVPAAAALSRTSSSTASRWSSSPTSCSRCSCAVTASPPRRRRATSPTTSR